MSELGAVAQPLLERSSGTPAPAPWPIWRPPYHPLFDSPAAVPRGDPIPAFLRSAALFVAARYFEILGWDFGFWVCGLCFLASDPCCLPTKIGNMVLTEMISEELPHG